MKILFTVESYLPARNGMQEVVSQLAERLVKRGHAVTIATSANKDRQSDLINGVKIRSFNISGNYAMGYAGDLQSYQDYLLTSDFDVIANFAAQQWATDLIFPIIDRIKSRKVFVPTGFSGLNTAQYAEYYKQMEQWLHSYDMNVFLSHTYRDIVFAKKAGIKNYIIIPNGAAAEEFQAAGEDGLRKKLGVDEDSFLVLHVGTFTGVKGHFEAIRIFNRAKIRKAVLLLAGNDPGKRTGLMKIKNFVKGIVAGLSKLRPAGAQYYRLMAFISNYLYLPNLLRNKRIIVHSLSRKEVVAAFRSSDLFLFPSMIECSPIVLFESMAGRTAFLTADVGNAAEIVEWTGGGKVLQTDIAEDGMSYVRIDESAKLLENLWYNTEDRIQAGESGYTAFLETFNWEKITDRYEELFIRLLKAN